MKLKYKKNRQTFKKFHIENEHILEEAYKTKHLLEIYKTKDCKLNYDVKTNIVEYKRIKKMSKLTTPNQFIGVSKYIDEQELKNRLLIIDDIQDPGNLGTIIRSAVAFNVDTIVLSNNSVDLYNEKVIRATQGMIYYINIIRRDLKEFLKELKEQGYYIYSSSVKGKKIKGSKKEKYAIIVGNEGTGIKAELLELSDELIKIDMNSKCESLNVAVATSILLYEMNKE